MCTCTLIPTTVYTSTMLIEWSMTVSAFLFRDSKDLMLTRLGLSYWLVNAFNGEWHRTSSPSPDSEFRRLLKRFVSVFR